jgi:hypothetical protein
VLRLKPNMLTVLRKHEAATGGPYLSFVKVANCRHHSLHATGTACWQLFKHFKQSQSLLHKQMPVQLKFLLLCGSNSHQQWAIAEA